jgi:hypothetical protein
MPDPGDLSDIELWQGIAANAEAMAHIARQAAIIEGGHAGAANADTRAALVAAHNERRGQLRREIETYQAELGRRHPDLRF